MPEKVQPISNFDIQRYLGTWYEIARLDHSFERGLEKITAEYSVRDDGAIRVINRGYSIDKREWDSAEGKAYFVNEETEGYLKVSFFGPFYGSYVIFEIDEDDYQYAFVSGPDLTYLWLLARSPSVPEDVLQRFQAAAKERGFDTTGLIFVNHE